MDLISLSFPRIKNGWSTSIFLGWVITTNKTRNLIRIILWRVFSLLGQLQKGRFHGVNSWTIAVVHSHVAGFETALNRSPRLIQLLWGGKTVWTIARFINIVELFYVDSYIVISVSGRSNSKNEPDKPPVMWTINSWCSTIKNGWFVNMDLPWMPFHLLFLFNTLGLQMFWNWLIAMTFLKLIFLEYLLSRLLLAHERSSLTTTTNNWSVPNSIQCLLSNSCSAPRVIMIYQLLSANRCFIHVNRWLIVSC